MARLYALLVGINAYDNGVEPLQGCLQDVETVASHLRDSWPAGDLIVETLLDEQATRPAVMARFRDHLGQAGQGDVALFHYSGHGAHARSAPEFLDINAGGKDEGLICIDSRRDGGLDLADKELAVLIEGVAAKGPHLAVLLDCCHSGSGTRDLDEAMGFVARTTTDAPVGRAFESYADGWYAAQKASGEALSVPEGRHILLAACERFQKAKETPDHGGVFTTALVKVLQSGGDALSYPELFMRTRAAARTMAQEQDPQFETAGGFDAWTGFLGRARESARPRYYLGARDGGWSVECGAVHGLPTDADRPATFAVEHESGEAAGGAVAVSVGAQRSTVTLDFAADPAASYRATVTSLPAPPMLVGVAPDVPSREKLDTALAAPSADPVAITEAGLDRAHQIAVDGGGVAIRRRGTGEVIQQFGSGDTWAAPAVDALRRMARWERTLALANPCPQIDPSLVDLSFAEIAADGSAVEHPGEDATVTYARAGDGWRRIPGRIRVTNRTDQMLHAALVYFSGEYGIYILRNDEVPAGQGLTLWGDDPSDYFDLADGQPESIERFKLIVSTEGLDDFLLVQPPLPRDGATRGIGSVEAAAPVRKPVEGDWFTRDVRVRVVREAP